MDNNECNIVQWKQTNQSLCAKYVPCSLKRQKMMEDIIRSVSNDSVPQNKKLIKQKYQI